MLFLANLKFWSFYFKCVLVFIPQSSSEIHAFHCYTSDLETALVIWKHTCHGPRQSSLGLSFIWRGTAEVNL